jgi:hypothetical protein
VGACALVWAIWKIMNDYIFNNAKSTSFMQVILLAMDPYVVLPTTNEEMRELGY